MRILFCYDKVPYPLTSGDNLHAYHVVKSLSPNHEVYLFCLFNPTDSRQDLETIKSGGICKEYISMELPRHSAIGRIIDILQPAPQLFLPFRHPGFKSQAKARIKEIVQEKAIDIIHVHSPFMGLLLADSTGAPKLMDLADSISLSFRSSLWRLPRPAKLYFVFKATLMEKYLMRRFGVTTVSSPTDMEKLKKLDVKADIRVVATGVDGDYFSPAEQAEEDFPSILFSGMMSFHPNIEAVLYIYKDILPLIRAQIPEIKFYIVGANPSPEIKRLAGDEHIIITGFVEDMRAYISKASVVLAPMHSGSGLKNKILEAMALGKAVVTNPLGVEWMDKEARECIAIASTAAEIAQRTVELLQNGSLREDLGRKASRIVREKYTWALCAQRFENIYEGLLRTKTSKE